MLNKYPLWKNILLAVVLLIGITYALPNLYPDDYAVQITGASATTSIDTRVLELAEKALDKAGIAYRNPELGKKNAMLRFDSGALQLAAQPVIKSALGADYLVALNLAPTTPEWLDALGAGPMKLGLDLRGGVHFLLEVDMDQAVAKRMDIYSSDVKRKLREEKIRYRGVKHLDDGSLEVKFSKEQERAKGFDYLRKEYPEFAVRELDKDGKFYLKLVMTEAKVKEIADYAVKQNLTTLRNRVNELGVAEPLVQRQGRDRIVVELPGVQDTARAKRVIGKTANLEFRLEARLDDSSMTVDEFPFRDNPARTARVEKDIIVTGDSVANASANFDENGRPQVNITLDGKGGKIMSNVTRDAVKRRMAVVFIEHKAGDTDPADGEDTARRIKIEKSIISLATIQTALGSSFRITGLDSVAESSELALLLRAGALAAPIYFVEERTVGPSLGKQNIDSGLKSVVIGFSLVVVFMLVYYRLFGLIANLALILNLVLLSALMSIISATLTLPGIAGIVLTVGMAVDANVLIYERIKEEIKNGLPVQSAIHSGYSRAFVAIFDANITTLLVAIILFAVGTGPVKGFAVTLSIGILTSMFTAIVFTRAMVNAIYGGRNIKQLAI
ncbi:MAG: protein translocase subunit SecD [Gammaproteobacteria bacterium]|nr:MAG: protein translocase subunit SecD [Gammaproteobacteria bacterium]